MSSSSYRALFARPGARSLALACGLGWLSFASYGLAVVLAVQAATGSFVVAGEAVGAFSAGAALLAPVRGRFVDRRGPPGLVWLAAAHAVALALLVLACASARSPWLLIGCASLAGAFAPPLIATARARWPQVSGPRLARTGHAVNAALGDVAQVLGPALTGALAALASPLVALGMLVPGATIGAVILATSNAAAERGAERRRASHRVWGVLAESIGLRTIVLCELTMGVWLGALEVAAPAIAAERGAAAQAALPLAVFAAGSIGASLWCGAQRTQQTPARRYVTGSIVVAAVLPLCLPASSLAGITVVLAVAGPGFGLLNLAVFELLDRVVESDPIEAFTWLTGGQGAGLAAGAIGAGQLSRGGTASMLILVALPAALAAAIALARRATLGARR